MAEPREREAAPAHWHLVREEDGHRQVMLPIYHKQRDAVAAVTALRLHEQREYAVEACEDEACQR